MKHLFLKFSLLAALMLGFASCGSDDDNQNDTLKPAAPDLTPISVNIALVNADGENLLCNDTPENLMNSDIHATYNNSNYPLDWSFAQNGMLASQSRAAATFSGLQLHYMKVQHGSNIMQLTDQFYISFGDFNPYENLNLSFTLHLERAHTSYEISLHHVYDFNQDTLQVTDVTDIYLNDLPVDYSDGLLTITVVPAAD